MYPLIWDFFSTTTYSGAYVVVIIQGQSPSPLRGMGFFFYHHVRPGVRGCNYVQGQ